MIKKKFRNKLLFPLLIVMMIASATTACGPKEDFDNGMEQLDNTNDAVDAMTIGNIMNSLEAVASDPMIPWEEDEVFYVKVSLTGADYKCDNEEVLASMETLMPKQVGYVSETANGLELWAEKNAASGAVTFSTSWDYDTIAEFSPSLAKRFSETSVKP